MSNAVTTNTLTNIVSTSRIDGEVVKATHFIAETAHEEFYADKDCIVVFRDDLGDADLVIEIVELGSDDTCTETLYTDSVKGGYPIYVTVPKTNPAYVYHVVTKEVNSEMILDALMQQAHKSKLSHNDLGAVAQFEKQFLGNACGGNFAMYYQAVCNQNNTRYILQFKETIIKMIQKLTRLI